MKLKMEAPKNMPHIPAAVTIKSKRVNEMFRMYRMFGVFKISIVTVVLILSSL